MEDTSQNTLIIRHRAVQLIAEGSVVEKKK